MYKTVDRRLSDVKMTPEEVFDKLVWDVFLQPASPKPPGYFVMKLSEEKRLSLRELKSDSPVDTRCLRKE
jgi:hypothetical protein